MGRKLGVLAVGALSLLLAGCDFEELAGGDRYREDFHKSYDVQPGGRLTVENSNGTVEISGWEKNTVDISGTKYASTEQTMHDIRIDIVQNGNTVSIRTITPFGFRGNMGARYTIRVPNKFELDRIGTSNGSLRVEDLAGTVRLKTSNGAVRTSHINGRLDIETSNGGVEVMSQTGDTSVRTSNGRITADDVKGLLEAHSSNGSIHATLSDPLPNAPIKADTSNGSIDLTVAKLKDNPIHATTSNSSITLRLPQASNARLRAHTSNAHVSTDFDVLVNAGAVSKHSLEGNLGSGGPLIDLGTSNGSIKILKY